MLLILADKAAVVDCRKRILDLKTEFMQSYITNIFCLCHLFHWIFKAFFIFVKVYQNVGMF